MLPSRHLTTIRSLAVHYPPHLDIFLVDQAGFNAWFNSHTTDMPSGSLIQARNVEQGKGKDPAYHFDVIFPKTDYYVLAFVNYGNLSGQIWIADSSSWSYSATATYTQTKTNIQTFTSSTSQPNAALLIPLGIAVVISTALFLALALRRKRTKPAAKPTTHRGKRSTK